MENWSLGLRRHRKKNWSEFRTTSSLTAAFTTPSLPVSLNSSP
jgi:hypothetical protein